MNDRTFVLRPGRLTLADTRRLSEPGSRIALDPDACEAVRAAQAVVGRAVAESRRVYGINTGMGSLADSAIDGDLLSELQRRLILSNAAGPRQEHRHFARFRWPPSRAASTRHLSSRGCRRP